MKNYVSTKEFKILLILGFLASFMAFASIGYILIPDFIALIAPKTGGLDLVLWGGRMNLIPFFRFFSLFIFVILFKTNRFILSSLFTFFCFSIFSTELYFSWDVFIKYGFIEMSLVNANVIDYLAFFLVTILLFWQILLLLRKSVRKINSLT